MEDKHGKEMLNGRFASEIYSGNPFSILFTQYEAEGKKNNEESLMLNFDNLEAYYPFIAPHAHNQNLFSVSTRPRPSQARARAATDRLIGPSKDTQIGNDPTRSPNFNSSHYADHIRGRLILTLTQLSLAFDQRMGAASGFLPHHFLTAEAVGCYPARTTQG